MRVGQRSDAKQKMVQAARQLIRERGYGATAFSDVLELSGAPRGSVYGLILKEAGWLTGIGIALGLVCSLGAATLMRKLLFGTAAWDAGTLASVAVILAAAAMLASYIPAHRAAGVDPAEALRTE